MRAIYAGVDHSIAGNGGPICVGYLPGWQRFLETIFALILFSYGIQWSKNRLTYPEKTPILRGPQKTTFEQWRRYLLAFLCVIFGVEFGYKFASETTLYILNPCHILTFMQILLLFVDPQTKWAAAVFRVHIYTLPGATLALVFPVLNTRLLPLEVFTYYVQHIGILLVPVLLMASGGSYTVDKLNDVSWPVFSTSILFIYHFLPLQFIGLITQVNLNNMICPAVSDPFRGRWYRIAALAHQSIYVPAHGKLYGLAATRLAGFIRNRYFLTYQNGSVTENGTAVRENGYCKNHIIPAAGEHIE